jgi:tetratricopeptide (TPR) repeat protein
MKLFDDPKVLMEHGKKMFDQAKVNLKALPGHSKFFLVALCLGALILPFFSGGGVSCSSSDTLALVRQIIQENWQVAIEEIESIRTVDTIRANGGSVCRAVGNTTVQGPYGGTVTRNITYSVEPTSKSGEIYVTVNAFALASTKNEANAPNARGKAHYDNKEYDAAIADYNEAIRLVPKYAISYMLRGSAYYLKGDNDHALADYNEAIRLDPEFTLAYNGRGSTYLRTKDYDKALADYDKSIQLEPKNAVIYFRRGFVLQAMKQYDRALGNYSQALSLKSNYPEAAGAQADAYFGRGIFNLYSGLAANAQADLKYANELNPKYAYAALWLDIVERRNNIPSHLAQATSQVDMTKWPAPVVRLFLGELTPTDVLTAANDTDPRNKQGQVCESNFYSGEFALFQNKKSEAQRLFRLAASGCPENFVERDAAINELKILADERSEKPEPFPWTKRPLFAPVPGEKSKK